MRDVETLVLDEKESIPTTFTEFLPMKSLWGKAEKETDILNIHRCHVLQPSPSGSEQNKPERGAPVLLLISKQASSMPHALELQVGDPR
ncbi:hypothetical protein SLA2020_051040 [Shorea laevis]